jgi:TrmH family RNA methyltransferase
MLFMNRLLRITSPANPRIKQVVRLRTQRERAATGQFIAEGWREVQRAIEAGLDIEQLFLCGDLLHVRDLHALAARPPLRSLSPDVAWFDLTATAFAKMAYLREPEGILAVVRQPRWSLADLPAVTGRTLYLVAVGTEKPGNLGAMVRTADAAGCEAVFAAGTPVDPFNPNAIRSSTAAVFVVPTLCAPPEEVIAWLLDQKIRIVAATPSAAVAHTLADLTGPLAIAIGPEDTGLDDAWLQAAEKSGGSRVAIPMHGRAVDSLNASAAAAVLLFEAARQRAS